jgi:hypothetical protein
MPAAPSVPSSRSCRDYWFAFAVVGVVFAALALATWRKWPDVLVDFGLQLYLPWMLSSGQVLYRDVAYISGGPLSQYYHALLFKVFGVSFLTVIISNLLILGLFLALIYHCVIRASDQVTALAACLAVLLVFAFAHYTEFGIFNYITPYAHEAFHGVVLSTVAIALLAKWFSGQKAWLVFASGVFLGLTFLTKPEVFLALVLSVIGGLALYWRSGDGRGLFLRAAAMLMLGAAIPLAACFLFFYRVEEMRAAVLAVLGGWAPLLTSRAADNRFYRWCLGLDAPAHHLRSMAVHFLALTAAFAFYAWLFRRRTAGWFDRGLLGIAVLVVLTMAWEFDWHECGTSLPLLCLAALAILVWRAKSRGLDAADVFPILWTVFSLGLLLKLGLFPRIWHYGFALAMPAFVTGIYLLLWLAPRLLESYNVQTSFLRATVCLALFAGFVRLNQYSQFAYDRKTLPIGHGADKFWAFAPGFRSTGIVAATALRWMETNAPAGATLAVLPEGVMLNFLSRRPNPSGYPGWSPPEVAAFGQGRMCDAFIRHNPDYVMLVGISSSEFGEKYFGIEKRFGLDLMQWIESHYQPAVLIGHDWLKDGGFGIKIFRKRNE